MKNKIHELEQYEHDSVLTYKIVIPSILNTLLCIEIIINLSMMFMVKYSIPYSDKLLDNVLKKWKILPFSLNRKINIDEEACEKQVDIGKDKPSEKKQIDHYYSEIHRPTRIYQKTMRFYFQDVLICTPNTITNHTDQILFK